MNRQQRRTAVARRLATPTGGPGDEIMRMQREVDRYRDACKAAHKQSAEQLENLVVTIEYGLEHGVVDVGLVLEALRFLATDHKKLAVDRK